MKKLFLFLAFVVCALFVQAQTNLVLNPSFETWTNGTSPDNWIIPANSTHGSSLTWSKETSIFKDGAAALKVVIGTTQNPGIQQIIPITAGKTYTVSVSYYVVSGDGTDVRIWSSFKNAAGFYVAANWTTAVAADAQIQNKLQGSGTDQSAYFTITNNNWGTYTTEFVAPADATDFVFEVRTYKNATAIWDNMSLVEKTITDIPNINDNTIDVSLTDRNLTVSNSNTNTIEIYSINGIKLKTLKLVNNVADLKDLSKGVYLVKIDNFKTKILLK